MSVNATGRRGARRILRAESELRVAGRLAATRGRGVKRLYYGAGKNCIARPEIVVGRVWPSIALV